MDGTIAASREDDVKKKAIRRAILVFVLVMIVLTFFSNTLLTLSLAEVTVQQPASGPLSHEVTGSGKVEAAETADIYVEVNWPVGDVAVKTGDTVEAGQELFTLKTGDADDSLKDNQARYEQKQLSLQKLQDSYMDAARSSDEKQMRGIARDIDSTKLDLQILERQIANLQRQLAEFGRMASPVAGTVIEVNAAKGAPVPSGKAAVRIADAAKGQRLKATIPDTKAPYVQLGDETELIFAALGNARVKAAVTDIRDLYEASSQTSASGSSAPSKREGKEITFSLNDSRLKGGETGEFGIIKKTDAFRSLLPSDAVREDDKGKYVLVMKEKKGPLGSEYVLQRASVQAGDADDWKTSIENGVTPLDKVVVSSSKPVAEGDRVMPGS
ncbi:Putative efflux system component YknX [Paenibacillus konkukensis]|uniref:Efflux system component YknX n=1 Tax=Paenibacillus konkukensis TaxID=2020716 RepID=A0ABY4RMS9_9BACL|nr:efflux RND transporter periplasmic adaptor subunit [Paenibacillus konkukensis]UQZ82984.1 Putative efflux system component YknX [Paenibacillus konkukensis]